MGNQPTISSDLIRGHIDTIIMHTLLESDKFAQQISDSIESKSENAYKINQATLYSSLKRLEALKLVDSYWHDYDGGRRKYFKITDSGKQTVNENLSSWSYSRSVIDKLMDLSPTPVFERKFTDKPPIGADYAEKSISDSDICEVKQEIPLSQDSFLKTEIKEEKAEKPEEIERNFRTVLNGLIQISERTSQKTPLVAEQIEPLYEDEKNVGDVMKFNETIDETNYNENKSNFSGKIDYGDLTIKAEKEGYKVRVSSKDSAKPHGNILISKLNFVVSALIFAVALVELGVLALAFPSAFFKPSVIVLSTISLIPLIIFSALYFVERTKTSKNKISADGILIAAITAFNLILVTLALGFIFEIDFSNATTLLFALIIPIVYYVDAILFFAFRFLLAPKKAFSIK